MQNGPKFLVAATVEKANTYGFAGMVIQIPKVESTCHTKVYSQNLAITDKSLALLHTPPGGTSSSDFWVLKEDKQALDDSEKQIKRKKDVTLSIGQARYLQRWLDTFVDKPKKRIWTELKSIAHHRVPSLGTFYTRTKDESLEHYLREWFDAEKLISILAFLGIRDSEITEAYAQLNEQSQKSERAKREMLSRGVYIL